MKKKLICAATISAFAPAHLMAQALDPGQRPMAMVYYEVPFGAVQSKDAQSAFGLRILANQKSSTLVAPPATR
jgi:hypothetical protein